MLDLSMKKNDETASVEELKSWVEEFCGVRGWTPFHDPKDLAIGLVTEASELLEVFRFVPERELAALVESPKARAAIADELADSLYFILRFAQLYKFDLVTCLREKLVKNEVKYPVNRD